MQLIPPEFHAHGESSCDWAYIVPIGLLLQIDEYVRAVSGGFVVTTTASWYLPAAHSWQVLALEAPVAAENLPAGQSTQLSKTSVYTWYPVSV